MRMLACLPRCRERCLDLRDCLLKRTMRSVAIPSQGITDKCRKFSSSWIAVPKSLRDSRKFITYFSGRLSTAWSALVESHTGLPRAVGYVKMVEGINPNSLFIEAYKTAQFRATGERSPAILVSFRDRWKQSGNSGERRYCIFGYLWRPLWRNWWILESAQYYYLHGVLFLFLFLSFFSWYVSARTLS